MHPQSFLEMVLLYAILPVWLLAGFGDATCHRILRIETTSGWRESALHWLMLAQLGIGLMAILLLDIDAAVIALFAAVCVVHEITLVADLRFAHAHRIIPPLEQWVHGVQQSLPWIVLLTLCAMHPQQALALLGLGSDTPRWTLQPRAAPLPPGYLPAFIAAAFLLVALPFATELARALRASSAR